MSVKNKHWTHLVQGGVFGHDLLAAFAAFLLSIGLRLGPAGIEGQLLNALGFMLIAAVLGSAFGLNRGVWRYASLSDLEAIFKTATGTVALFAVILFLINRLDSVPRSSLFISWWLLIALLSAGRIAYRIWRSRRARHADSRGNDRNVILIGATDGAENFIKSVQERADLPYNVVGIIDERNRRTGLSIRGVRVLGDIERLEDIVEQMNSGSLPVDSVIMTKSALASNKRYFDQLTRVAKRHNLKLLRLPEIAEIAPSDARAIEPRPIVLEDLLPRAPLNLDNESVRSLIHGSIVLVTGAGGSIGSELCRQLCDLEPARIVLLDVSEFMLYSIESELRQRGGNFQIVARLGNVRDRAQINALLAEQRPDFVFHAAALKHVPIVERQPLDGLATNVIGTRNVADAAMALGVKAMIFISTDKAINPTNVMGATKRFAEAYCQAQDLVGQTRFLTVRFGNVLGSTGSVVPLFERQIKAGGPVTVTHPEIERYFMTIPEAVQLVVHAMAHGLKSEDVQRGSIFVLDMGRPVKILDVARRMIELAGFEPEKEIRIEFVGLRPGEKLYEELFDPGEAPTATGIKGVLSAQPRRQLGPSALLEMLVDLEARIATGDAEAAIEILRRVVPEYTPDARSSVSVKRDRDTGVVLPMIVREVGGKA